MNVHLFENLKSLIKDIESNEETWNNWTSSDKQFQLFSYLHVMENDFSKTTGLVTHHLDFRVGSNDLGILYKFWRTDFNLNHYDTTKFHFIVDIKNKKVIEILSCCF